MKDKLIIAVLLLTPFALKAGRDKETASRESKWSQPMHQQNTHNIEVNCPYSDCNFVFTTHNRATDLSRPTEAWVVNCPNCKKTIIIEMRFVPNIVQIFKYNNFYN